MTETECIPSDSLDTSLKGDGLQLMTAIESRRINKPQPARYYNSAECTTAEGVIADDFNAVAVSLGGNSHRTGNTRVNGTGGIARPVAFVGTGAYLARLVSLADDFERHIDALNGLGGELVAVSAPHKHWQSEKGCK